MRQRGAGWLRPSRRAKAVTTLDGAPDWAIWQAVDSAHQEARRTGEVGVVTVHHRRCPFDGMKQDHENCRCVPVVIIVDRVMAVA